MTEQITAIEPYEGRPEGYYCQEAGFQITTTEQTITLAIDDEPSCCESWGYFLTEDDTEKFIGAALLGVSLTDTNRSKKRIIDGWDMSIPSDAPDVIELDHGAVMFVDIETDRGVLQFVAYNAHNGYYGHDARVSSKQLEHAVTL